MKKLMVLVLVLAVGFTAQAAIIGAWNFDGSTGLEDSSGNGYHGTLGSGTSIVDGTLRVDGSAGGGMYVGDIDASGHAIMATVVSFTGLIKWDATVKGDIDSYAPVVMAKGDSTRVEMGSSSSNAGKVYFYTGVSGGNVWFPPDHLMVDGSNAQSPVNMLDGQWHRFVASVNSAAGKASVWVDGNRSDTTWTPGAGITQNDFSWVIGGNDASANDVFSGYLDDVMLYDIPEPATICLLGLGGLALLRKKRA